MNTLSFIKDYSRDDLDLASIIHLEERLFHLKGICPVSINEKNLFLAANDSFDDLRTLDNLKKTLGKKIQIYLAADEQIDEIKKYIFSHMRADAFEGQKKKSENEGSVEDLKIFTGDLTDTVKLANRIIIKAHHEEATDIHIQKAGQNAAVRFRIDGILYDALSFPVDIFESLITRLKVMSHLDIAEKRLPQSGRATVRINKDTVNLRISTLPSRTGEKISIRFLYGTHDLLPIRSLGLNEHQIDSLDVRMKAGKGIFIVGGPTGTGKTTTLYSIIQKLNDGTKNIITLEDPPEIQIGDGVTQVQVGKSSGLQFSDGIRSILRHDPDIILIGEIRDRESARASFEAALTGHLVLATVHMPTILDIVERLYQLDIDHLTIESSLIGVATQRLFRKICHECAFEINPDKEAQDFFSDFDLTLKKDFESKGCCACHSRGYMGRSGIFDIHFTDEDSFLKLFRSREKSAFSRKEKYRKLAKEAMNAIQCGKTNAKEVMRSLW